MFVAERALQSCAVLSSSSQRTFLNYRVLPATARSAGSLCFPVDFFSSFCFQAKLSGRPADFQLASCRERLSLPLSSTCARGARDPRSGSSDAPFSREPLPRGRLSAPKKRSSSGTSLSTRLSFLALLVELKCHLLVCDVQLRCRRVH